jgi:hypothetical protein
LENVSKPANMATTSSNVDIIEQYLNGDVKINFVDLYPSGRIQRPLAHENRRNSFAGSATTEGIRRRDKEIDDWLIVASKLKLESVANDSANSQISQAFYSTKSHPLPNKGDEGFGSMFSHCFSS